MRYPSTSAPMRGAPVEVVTPIKPSEAIRLGCLTTTQAFDDLGGNGVTTACVVIAAGIGGFNGPWFSLWPNGPPRCPATLCFRVASAIHLNDNHRWSRERIADWLEGLGL